MESIYKNIERFNVDIRKGLSTELVKLRFSQGLSNTDTSIPSQSVTDIIKNNIFTLFNLINAILALALIYAGSYKNLMFAIVVICNSVIGIVQEIRAKKTIDKLNLISSKSIKVIRDGQEITVTPEDAVLDDIIHLSAGDQIIADCIMLDGFCEINESLLTGESDLISKKSGDSLLSGSFVASGNCFARICRVGKDNYASQILHGAKYIKSANSQIMDFLNKLIKFISIAIVPIGVWLFINQLKIFKYDLNLTITGTSAALIGMIPEGLVLLSSTALALGVIRLSKKRVLVQDIYCIESLARVDTLCLDKTGTITEGKLNVTKVIPQTEFWGEKVEEEIMGKEISHSLNNFVNSLNDANETFCALKKRFYNPSANPSVADQIMPFSSFRKWSGAFFKDKGLYVVGAAEFIFNEIPQNTKNKIKEYSKEYRVLALAHSQSSFQGDQLPKNINLMSLILLKDKIKPDAKETLKFFADQGVNVKIISGDSPLTVSSVAKEAGVLNFESYKDMSDVKDKSNLTEIANKYTVFGRVTPEQKKLLIKAFKLQGHTVAMIGDGVNDVLALKESDCGIAMASGSDAARTVSLITLLDSEFSSLPAVVAQGRQVINNIQRTSSLFITKTIYSFFLAVLFLFISAPYPFIPIQMTLISTLTIGIPSLILTLETNNEKIKGSFINNILKNSIPFAIIVVLNVILGIAAYKLIGIPTGQYSTICVTLTGITGIVLLYKTSMPFNKHRKFLIYTICILFIISIIFYKNIFSLYTLDLTSILILAVLLLINAFVFKLMDNFLSNFR